MTTKTSKSFRFVQQIITIWLLLIVLFVPLWSQTGNGSLRGTVQDQTKAVIPNVTVVLTNTATGVSARTVSNQAGLYVFPAIVPGNYKLSAEAPGMAKFEATVTIEVQKSETIDITLKPAATETIVSVQDVTPMVVTDTPMLGHTLERTRIEQLPLNGRSIMNLLSTVPGVTYDSNGDLRTYGVRKATNDTIVDGASLVDMRDGGNSVTRMPGLESIQEFRVDNNAASAKFARQTNIIFITKGGTNELHGSLFETNRDNYYGVARARDNFTNTAAKLIRNEYGGSVGGPVWIPKVYNGKNRTFFFFSYEGMKLRSGSYGNYRVPTDAMRNGDFTGLVNSAGTLSLIYNPYTTDPISHARQQFNYNGVLNTIDPKLESPLMKYIYSILPEPNVPGANPLVKNNYIGPAPNIQDQMTWSMRFDQHISDKDSVYVRLTNSMATTYRPAAGGVPTLDGFGNSRRDTYPNKSIAGTWTRSFSPTFFSELMFSATRNLSTTFSGDPSRYYATELGLPNPNHQPGYPVINNIGVGTGRSNYFQPVNWNRTFYNYFILEDNFTKTKGRHELQFGVHLRYDQLTYMPQQQRTAGSVTFQAIATALYNPAYPNRTAAVPNTGHVAASSYLGLANYEYRLAKGKYYMRQNEDAWYLQDNFRVTQRLTLNLGFRWQFTPFAKDKQNIFNSFDPVTGSVVLSRNLSDLYALGVTTPSLINVLTADGAKFVEPKDVGLPPRLVYNNWHDVGPHVGFAYRAFSGAKSFVIRGGYATNYFPLPMWGWSDRMRLNAPFAGIFQNYALTVGAQSPDGIRNWGLVYVPGPEPGVIAGLNSANTVSLTNPQGISIGDSSFQEAYYNPHQPSSRVHDWNLTVEKEVAPNMVARAAYVGTHSTNQDSYDNWNAQIPAYVWYVTTGLQYPTGTYGAALVRPYDSPSPTATVPKYPYGDLQEYRKDGWGNSNGIQLELERRYAKGYAFQLMYNMINTFRAGGNGWYSDSSVEPIHEFLPGAVPADRHERMKMLLYMRDTTVPKHEVRWNWLVDLPFGKGKPLGGHARPWLDALIGGWQVAGMGRLWSNYFPVPTDLLPTGTPIQYYGHKYPIQDCRGGECLPGYLLWNGYIPSYQINSFDANGKPNGIMGVPPEYKPAVQPLWPYPANYLSLNPNADPLYGYYGSNTVWIPLKDGTVQQIDFGGLSPFINQNILSTRLWNVDASMFKSFNIRERAKLRVQFDFFNVFNVPGNSPTPVDDTGVAWTNTNANPSGPRVMQLSARLSW